MEMIIMKFDDNFNHAGYEQYIEQSIDRQTINNKEDIHQDTLIIMMMLLLPMIIQAGFFFLQIRCKFNPFKSKLGKASKKGPFS